MGHVARPLSLSLLYFPSDKNETGTHSLGVTSLNDLRDTDAPLCPPHTRLFHTMIATKKGNETLLVTLGACVCVCMCARVCVLVG